MTMKVLAAVALLTVAVGAQYSPKHSSLADLTLSELSKQSPRAGPARKTYPVRAEGLVEGQTSSPLSALRPYTQAQYVGSNAGGVGSGAFALTVSSEQLLPRSLHGQRNRGGYAVTESPEDHQPQIPRGYQIVPQRLPVQSPSQQPQVVQQFQYPVQQELQNSQPQQNLFVPYTSSREEQYLRETPSIPSPQVSSNAPLNFPQVSGQPQPTYSLQQQFYAQEPQIQYVQSNPSVPVTTPSPPVTTPAYAVPVTAAAVSPSISNQAIGHGNSFGVDPSIYTGSQQYFTVPLNDVNLKQQQEQVQYTSESPLRGFYQRQLYPQSTTARPLIPAPRTIQIGYQPQTTSLRSKEGLSQGIYNPQPVADIGSYRSFASLGKEDIAQFAPQPQLKVLTYAPQQPVAGSYAPGANYGVQGALVRNPIDYASPFARQELIESRQREPSDSTGQINQVQSLRKLHLETDYDSINNGDDGKQIASLGQGFSGDYYG